MGTAAKKPVRKSVRGSKKRVLTDAQLRAEIAERLSEKDLALLAPPQGKWRDDIPERARDLCLLGLTDAEIAQHFAVNAVTFSQWKHSHPELQAAIHGARNYADAQVAASLFKRACGYTTTLTEKKTVNGVETVTEYKREYPPDVTAQVFWLKNRQPRLWREKVEAALVGAPDGEVTPRIVVKHIMDAMTEARKDMEAGRGA